MENQTELPDVQPIPEGGKTREVSRYAFPYYDLETSIEVAKQLHDRAGGKASLAQLASYLGHKDEFSGAFRAKLWGAKLFNLVDIKGNKISTTRLGEQLTSAAPGIQRDRRLAEAFLNVPLFIEVYRRYESSTLPSTREGLKRALQDNFGVAPRLISLALKSLERSAEQAGFKREGLNRLIHPVPIGLIEKGFQTEPEAEESHDDTNTHVVVPIVKTMRERTLPNGTHPAISGFLQELPSDEQPWTENERQRWLEAFIAMVKALYPTKEDK
jgi:hypothetical protein